MVVRFTFDPDGPDRYHEVSEEEFKLLKEAEKQFQYLNNIPEDHPVFPIYIRIINKKQIPIINRFPTLVGYA